MYSVDVHMAGACVSVQWLCVPFVLMSPHTVDISQTLTNNTLHAPWIGSPELKKTGQMIDHFFLFVRAQHVLCHPPVIHPAIHCFAVLILHSTRRCFHFDMQHCHNRHVEVIVVVGMTLLAFRRLE